MESSTHEEYQLVLIMNKHIKTTSSFATTSLNVSRHGHVFLISFRYKLRENTKRQVTSSDNTIWVRQHGSHKAILVYNLCAVTCPHRTMLHWASQETNTSIHLESLWRNTRALMFEVVRLIMPPHGNTPPPHGSTPPPHSGWNKCERCKHDRKSKKKTKTLQRWIKCENCAHKYKWQLPTMIFWETKT